MRFSRAVFALFLVCFASVLVFGQDKTSKDKDKNQPKSVEVKANVAVLDSSGNLDVDAKQEDIKIFEDGVEQKITYFAKKEPVLNLGLVIDNTGSMRWQLDTLVAASSL